MLIELADTVDEASLRTLVESVIGEALERELCADAAVSESIAQVIPQLGPGLIGDKANSMVFDNSKVTSLVPEFRPRVPYVRGAEESIEWILAHPEHQIVDHELDAAFDRLVTHARSF